MPILSDLRFFLFLTLISFLLIFGSVSRFLQPIENFFEVITVPLQYFSYRTASFFGSGLGALGGSFGAQKRIKELEDKLQESYSNQARLFLLEEENRVLKEQLGVSDLIKKYRFFPANTIGLTDNLIIDRGEKDQIKAGQVVVYKNNLIGVVSQTSPNTATIRILKDPNSKFLASTQSGAKGVVQGSFGTSLLLDKVLQKEDLKEGELVFAAGEKIGEDSFILPGLILGKISKVFKDPTQAFAKADVEPLISFEDLKIIFVLGQK